jgi:DNA-binding CsgD family transcriptional regulator
MLIESIPRKPVRPIGSFGAPALLPPQDNRMPFGADGRLRLVWDAEANERSRHLAFEILSALSVAVFVVTGNASVRLTNSAAERLARARRGVFLCQGRLMLCDAKLDERLRAIIRRVAAAPLSGSETLVVRAPEGAPLTLLIVPLSSEATAAGKSEALAAVLAGGPAARSEPPMDLVRAAYGLTPAETRVLFAIAGGWRACDYADAMGLSQNTVQTQLKALFAKMGCRRQADLVRKVLSDPLLRLTPDFLALNRS